MTKHLLFAISLLATVTLDAQNIRLVDKQLRLSGMLNDGTEQNFIGLEANDKIIVNCWRLSTKGSATISIKDLNRGNEIYKKESFDTLRDATINIPAKGIYVVDVKTGSMFGKDVKLTVDRVAAAHKAAPAAKAGSDTTAIEVVNTTVRAFAKNSPQSNNSVVTINLPPNTVYWVYWIGAGKDAIAKMNAFAASCGTIGAVYPSNDPLVLYGRKYLSALPMTKTSASVSYHFMDTKNTTAFKNKQQFSFYMFKSSEKITTEYALMPNNQKDLNMGISNESSNSAQDVQVRVTAFVVK